MKDFKTYIEEQEGGSPGPSNVAGASISTDDPNVLPYSTRKKMQKKRREEEDEEEEKRRREEDDE